MIENSWQESSSNRISEWDYREVVDEWYVPLYRFALSLSNVSDAKDLTQETFEVFLQKSWHIRDREKVKSWLFTTLYRRFLQRVYRGKKWREYDLDVIESLPDEISGEVCGNHDRVVVMEALSLLDERFRGPLVLFYLQDLSYKEIAGVLDIKIGTVMSRLARAKRYLRKMLESGQLA